VVAVRPMAAPAGGGDKVAEREVVRRAGSCIVVVVVFCLLKRPKTLVAGIAAAAGQGRLGPTRLAVSCLSFGWLRAHGRGRDRGVQTAVEMQETLRPEQGCVHVCLSSPDEL
jgi:hypothetical protein